VGYLPSMSIQPDDLPLHLSRIETAQGGWLIAVQAVSESQGARTLLLRLVLEQSIDEETFRNAGTRIYIA